MSGKNVYGLITNDTIDIDNKEDFRKLKKHKQKFNSMLRSR